LAFFITIKRLFVLIVVDNRDLLHKEKLNLKLKKDITEVKKSFTILLFNHFLKKVVYVSNPFKSFRIYNSITPDYGTRIIIGMPA